MLEIDVFATRSQLYFTVPEIFSVSEEIVRLLIQGGRVETERQKHRSRAFRALKFSIRAISSTIFDFEFSIRAISSGKMVEHFEHKKISSDHRAISSIILKKIFEQNRAFFERNQTFFEHDRAESTVNTNFYKIFQVIGIVLY